jgi:Uma2 family endonuclease
MSVDVQIPEAPKTAAASALTLPSIPPLENGDYLTRDEFERRYTAMPNLKKAELIEGRVYVLLPVHSKYHGEPHASIGGWLGVYSAHTPGVEGSNNATVRLDETNEPQPDVLLRIDEAAGGQTIIDSDDFLEGAPELIAEVAGSSASYDLREKLYAYQRNGVQEYIVWSIYEQQLDWFRLQAGEYARLNPDNDGIIRSRVFPGLWLDVTALLKDDMAKVLAVLQQGLASPEHREFINRLSSAKNSRL